METQASMEKELAEKAYWKQRTHALEEELQRANDELQRLRGQGHLHGKVNVSFIDKATCINIFLCLFGMIWLCDLGRDERKLFFKYCEV